MLNHSILDLSMQGTSTCPDINVTHGTCEVARDYSKRKHTLRLK